jgi:hypothetical protein
VNTCVWPDEPCDRLPDARGLCRKHWMRAKSQGRLDEFPIMCPVAPAGRCEATPPEWVCGTLGKYVNGCRGERCREASAAYKRAYKRARRSTKPVVAVDFSWLTDDPPCTGRTDAFFPVLSEDIDNGIRRWCVDGLKSHYARAVDPWAAARRICAACPMRARCLESALSYGKANQYGMVGGLDPWERRQLLKRRRKVAA